MAKLTILVEIPQTLAAKINPFRPLQAQAFPKD
jgi:hypothetical protein